MSNGLNWFTAMCLAVILILSRSPKLHADLSAPPSFTKVFSIGHNGSGQGGIIPNGCCTVVATPIDMTNIAGETIVQSAAGEVHSLLLSDDGIVYSFGSNFPSGQTGLGTNSSHTAIATPIVATNLADRKVVQMATTWRHNLLLLDDGTVRTFGSNRYGQLGIGSCCEDVFAATPIDSTNLVGKTIIQVGAGDDHSLLLADDGTVFSFGYNGGGQTGQGTTPGYTLIATPIKTDNMLGKKIVKIATGRHHNLLLADDGTVFSFGTNEASATGLGISTGNTPIATPIDMSNLAGKTVAQIAANGLHSLLLTTDGTVFSFGENEFGQTGQGTTIGNTPIATAIDATNLEGKKIKQIVAGSGYSFLLAGDGSVFSFGSNFAGATGQGTDMGKTLVAMPINTSNLNGLRITTISAGFSHSLLIAVPEPGGAMLGLIFGFATLLRRTRSAGLIGTSAQHIVASCPCDQFRDRTCQ
jgi:alpha-tubulin suppressor-like RCC1 family protein